MRLLVGLCLIPLSLLHAETAPKFRTDADGPIDPKAKKGAGAGDVPEWYRLVDGKFPPAGSAHAISGELIKVDHLERRFQIRVDRNDSQDRGVWDLPVEAALLPYASIHYQGAPAALQDIPLGTHLHGLFYLKAPDDLSPPPAGPNRRVTPEVDFRRCFRLEDDFTFHARQGQLWHIDAVNLDEMKLTATPWSDGKAAGAQKIFDLRTSTRVMEGRGFADLQALKTGQKALFNLTWATLYGPGRILDLWIDDASRRLATAHQLERHRNDIRERGLPGWVESVDDEAQIVTVTFFGNVDQKLFDELTLADPNAPPPKDGSPPPTEPRGGLAVARETLMPYDPVNDRKTGGIIEVRKIPPEPGSSGIQIRLRMDMLLEGYRPTRIVRFFPARWKVIALPREQEFFGRE